MATIVELGSSNLHLQTMAMLPTDYKNWLTELKSKVRSSQLKAAVAVNSAVVQFYWELGKVM